MQPAIVSSRAQQESYLDLFRRFARFGLLAWGGPVAQIEMIRAELVDDEGWVTQQQFNRVLAVYQVLPGPEASELCVYFGMVARGRIGGFLAGLGFMLPGFLLILLLSWFYMAVGLSNSLVQGVFYGFQPAVAALIARAVERIGRHAIHSRALLLIALVAGAAQLAGAHFALTLAAAGLAYVLVGRGRNAPALLAGISLLLLPLAWANANLILSIAFPELSLGLSLAPTSTLALFFSGLKAGLLTFGGAYTVIPFLQNDAVVVGAWMTNAQFLDGLALAGILPAPLVIFGTFVGFVGGGFLGAAALTAGIYLPAFGFTLIGHDLMEKLIGMQSLHRFLEGVTAGVIGLIAATSLSLFFSAVTDVPTLFIFVLSLVLLYRWSAKAAVAFVVLGAGLLGMLLF